MSTRLLGGAVTAAIAVLALVGCGGTGSNAGSPIVYRNRDRGWSISYPRQFTARPFSVTRGRMSYEGVSVANFAPPPNLGLPAVGATPQAFPVDGVIFQLVRSQGGTFAVPSASEARFPLSVRNFNPLPFDGFLTRKHIDFQANGLAYSAVIASGRRAQQEDLQSLSAIVSSLRFRRLSPGTMTASFYVLDRASAYPVGSITRYDSRTLPPDRAGARRPFYLVHVKDGFRALGWPDMYSPAKYGYPCPVQVDRSRSQLYCTNGNRWDLTGRVVAGPSQQPLTLYTVVTSSDGHVLVDE